MYAFIVNFNWLTYTQNIVDWCIKHNLTPIIVDNHSTYTPLLDYYSSKPCEIVWMTQNYGHAVVWDREILRRLGIDGPYIVTDPDLDLSGIPDDFMEILEIGIDRYPHFDKCGFSLEINDLPQTKEGIYIRTKVEPMYWEKVLDAMYFNAPIDTTFALYRKGIKRHSHRAIRTNRPYTARHLPWYHTEYESFTEEEKYYYQKADPTISTGAGRIMNQRR